MFVFDDAAKDAAYRAAIVSGAVQHISSIITDASGTEIPSGVYTIVGSPSMDSRCVEDEDVFNIAEMYIGELNMRIQNDTIRAYTLIGGEVQLIFGVETDTVYGTIEIPIGVWDIVDAKRDNAHFINIVGNDHIGRLSAPMDIKKVGLISLADVMQHIESSAGVEFAQTPQEVFDMFISDSSLMYGKCTSYEETCWEEIRLIAQMIVGFAFANREGKIEFRRFQQNSDSGGYIPEIVAGQRFRAELKEASFCVKAISYTDEHDNSYTYERDSHYADVMSILCISNNKYLWEPSEGVESYCTGVAHKMLQKLYFMKYCPGRIDFYGDPTIELGDFIELTGGIGGTTLAPVGFIVSGIYWQFRGPQTLTSAGAPAIGQYVATSTSSGGSGAVPVPLDSYTKAEVDAMVDTLIACVTSPLSTFYITSDGNLFCTNSGEPYALQE